MAGCPSGMPCFARRLTSATSPIQALRSCSGPGSHPPSSSSSSSPSATTSSTRVTLRQSEGAPLAPAPLAALPCAPLPCRPNSGAAGDGGAAGLPFLPTVMKPSLSIAGLLDPCRPSAAALVAPAPPPRTIGVGQAARLLASSASAAALAPGVLRVGASSTTCRAVGLVPHANCGRLPSAPTGPRYDGALAVAPDNAAAPWARARGLLQSKQNLLRPKFGAKPHQVHSQSALACLTPAGSAERSRAPPAPGTFRPPPPPPPLALAGRPLRAPLAPPLPPPPPLAATSSRI